MSTEKLGYDELVDLGYLFVKPGPVYHVYGPEKEGEEREQLGIYGMGKEALGAARKHYKKNLGD